jgi:deoxyribonuclease V
LIAGIDISAPDADGMATASIVVLNYPDHTVIEIKTIRGELRFPYVPGYLSFRECPLILAAYELLVSMPDLIIVDGQGIAHPRRFGLASHLGVLLGMPTIGCAKSRLCGQSIPPGSQAGSYSDLIDHNEVVGAVVRTKDNVKPVFVSIGHNIDLPEAIRWTLECCKGYRLPEPTRLAHIAASGRTIKMTSTHQIAH